MKNLVLSLLIFIGLLTQASGQLYIQSNAKGLYLEHTVVAKEGLYSVGRHYNVNPKFLAEYNNLDIDKGLNIGQVLHIPLSDTNFSQRTAKGTPVYYRVGAKEGLMKVSNANNKVKLASLREWNKLTNDNIKSGSRLIVGFLVAPEAGVASTASTPVAQSNTQEVKKDEPVAAAEKPVAKTEEANRTMPETKALVVADKEDQKKPDSNPVKSVSNDPAGADRTDQVATTGQGYFKPYFDQQIRDNPATRNETVTSGIFKTAYGLQEAKYYLLMDKVQPGTIIRIMNPDNNRAVFAKVLGEMSGIRQNKGLDIRISESAATSLGIGDPEKFIVKINY